MAGNPCVVVLIGLPGAGKSALARALESQLGLHRICRDSIRAALFPCCAFSPAEKRAANHAAMRALEVNCALGRHSVLDGRTFSRMAERLDVERQALVWGARMLPVWLDCPPAVARERVRADRDHPAADRSAALVDEVASRFDLPSAGCVRVDAALPLDIMVAEAVEAIRRLLD